MERLRVATYNIHKGRGLDRKVRIERIAQVLQEIGGDVIALQEVLSIEQKKPEDHQASFIAKELGMHYRIGETRKLHGGSYGNVTLSRYAIVHSNHYDLTQPGREERGCLRTDLQVEPHRVVHVYNLHLGTSRRERRDQARRLFDSGILRTGGSKSPRIVLGDFNEWTSGIASAFLGEHFESAPVRFFPRTYPGLFPIVHLDRIYFEGAGLEVRKVRVYRSPRALIASDHLPIVVDFRIRRC